MSVFGSGSLGRYIQDTIDKEKFAHFAKKSNVTK